jgi:Ca2+/Na+ antiporter
VRIVLASTTATPPVETKETSWFDADTRRTVGIAMGATGAAAVVVGGVFGVIAKLTYEHAKSMCGVTSPHPARCPPSAIQDRQTVSTDATVATIAMVGGGVLLAAGAVLYITAPKGTEVAIGPTGANGGGGLSLKGCW